MLTIDGSQGEGGGQILRSALTLSLVTGQPFRLEKIRAGRAKPGLARQHLTCVEAAQTISHGSAEGASLGSTTIEFHPGRVVPGSYLFDIGSAGSTTLVLQTILIPLLTASDFSRLTLKGGTHNPMAPPFDYLVRTFAPLINRLGPQLELDLIRPGFFPAGGGEFTAQIHPVRQLRGFDLLHRGEICRRSARAILSRIDKTIGTRQLRVFEEEFGILRENCELEVASGSHGPGNAVLVAIQAGEISATFSAVGERNRSPESVAQEVIRQATVWQTADVPVDEHLADQWLLPMALSGGGTIRTTPPTRHTQTNADVIRMFLPIRIQFLPESPLVCTIRVEV